MPWWGPWSSARALMRHRGGKWWWWLSPCQACHTQRGMQAPPLLAVPAATTIATPQPAEPSAPIGGPLAVIGPCMHLCRPAQPGAGGRAAAAAGWTRFRRRPRGRGRCRASRCWWARCWPHPHCAENRVHAPALGYVWPRTHAHHGGHGTCHQHSVKQRRRRCRRATSATAHDTGSRHRHAQAPAGWRDRSIARPSFPASRLAPPVMQLTQPAVGTQPSRAGTRKGGSRWDIDPLCQADALDVGVGPRFHVQFPTVRMSQNAPGQEGPRRGPGKWSEPAGKARGYGWRK